MAPTRKSQAPGTQVPGAGSILKDLTAPAYSRPLISTFTFSKVR